jgi:hypothetical protein
MRLAMRTGLLASPGRVAMFMAMILIRPGRIGIAGVPRVP